MATYQDLYNQSESEGTAKSMAAEYLTWDKVGDRVIGELVGIESYQGKFDKSVNQYRIMTDNGLVSVICGQIVDRSISQDQIGQGVMLEYRGHIKLANGQTANDFKVEVFPLPGSHEKAKSGPSMADDDEGPGMPKPYERI